MNPNPGGMIRSFSSPIVPTSQANPTGIQQVSVNNVMESANTATLCEKGANIVQEIVYRTSEIFKDLKCIQLPNGTTPHAMQASNDRKEKLQEQLINVYRIFRRLRTTFDRVNDDCGGMDYTPVESLIPYKDDIDSRPDLKKGSENYRHLLEENRELKEQLYLRSKYMKEVIDQQRKIIWDINTMLAMKNP